MAPILEREQTHRTFDTRDYGDDVINKFARGVGSEISFTKVGISCRLGNKF